MKIQELSVGDIVRYDEGLTPYSIRSIYRTGLADCVVLNDEKFPEGVIAYVERLRPIPLTEEILRANGLKDVDENDDRITFLCCDNFHIRRHADGSYWSVGVHSGDTLDAVISNVRYVHQLQHALTLAGAEKEIEV